MIIFNWKEDMVENMLFKLLFSFNSESVLCVLQLSCTFVPKIYLQFTIVRADCFRFTHGCDYKNVDIGTVPCRTIIYLKKKDLDEIILRKTSIQEFS